MTIKLDAYLALYTVSGLEPYTGEGSWTRVKTFTTNTLLTPLLDIEFKQTDPAVKAEFRLTDLDN